MEGQAGKGQPKGPRRSRRTLRRRSGRRGIGRRGRGRASIARSLVGAKGRRQRAGHESGLNNVHLRNRILILGAHTCCGAWLVYASCGVWGVAQPLDFLTRGSPVRPLDDARSLNSDFRKFRERVSKRLVKDAAGQCDTQTRCPHGTLADHACGRWNAPLRGCHARNPRSRDWRLR